MVPSGGMRSARGAETSVETTDKSGNVRTRDNLFMDGAEIFNFTIAVVPDSVGQLLKRSGKTLDEIDLFIFHQANKYMLEHLRKRTKIPAEKFYVAMSHCGNTVSSTIPIALKHAFRENRLAAGSTVMLVGFGVGYSWGATLLRWGGNGS